ncbi:hypothetical protein DXG01_000525 [Tephrocybe rancida]|nr:hypothetical protein DXG01_000525 [Tephrocybe rancida]
MNELEPGQTIPYQRDSALRDAQLPPYVTQLNRIPSCDSDINNDEPSWDQDRRQTEPQQTPPSGHHSHQSLPSNILPTNDSNTENEIEGESSVCWQPQEILPHPHNSLSTTQSVLYEGGDAPSWSDEELPSMVNTSAETSFTSDNELLGTPPRSGLSYQVRALGTPLAVPH